MLGAATVTLIAGSLLLGATAFADSPPSPPSRFVGTVMINGVAAANGAVVTASIDGNACGSANVGDNSAGAGRYVLDVPALDPGATTKCGTDGDTVSFAVNGVAANETGTWHNYDLGVVNLTVTASTTTPTATPTESATATPSGTATATNTTVAPSVTPQGPNTGSGVASSSNSAPMWLFALLGLGAVAFGVGGVTAVKRTK